ncbi:DHH family phosphoesterase [Halieaceae bacterium IMCC14734]|uniref:DHH family phosphoesterase n=1 Tax=Candidatus Litorirhabdus singularis TaxID=2518993 RepID=A0ABT3TIF5_9GAMM|nr:DHH family phosphoesterase [Candidatus Litorirhabdus singularis]MCX2981179.1 DHH family phosphoesterase [Candidatus Litorirhabdus singularis]
MTAFDVFNGDADGICALTQLRNAEPRDAQLITGVKRDIALLQQVQAVSGDQITVLDVSLDKNREALEGALEAGAEVFYCDHHFAGDIPQDKKLHALINTAPDVCTSILVNAHLKSAFLEWAVVGAFGDNLFASATTLAKPLDLDPAALEQLKNLGTYINYNGYGSSLEDLHFTPTDLYISVSAHASPFDFIQQASADFEKLEGGYQADMGAAQSLQPAHVSDSTAVYVLPNEAWARRVSGVYSNDLANASPARGHAVLTEKANGNYLVSVRAPLDNKTGADELCMEFPTGGGRKAAAGINDLPAAMLDQFIERFSGFYQQG